MQGLAQFEGDGGEDAILPRFLRDETSHGGPQPPPLPRQAGRIWHLLRAILPSGHLQRSILVGVVTAPVAFATFYLVLPIPARPVPVPIAAERPRNEVADALKVIAALEVRLAFAHDPQTMAAAATATAEGTADAAATPHEPDPIGLLLLSNVPDGATFVDGLATGPGTWAMAAGSPDQLVTALGDGFDKPALVDVELISRSGVALGTLKLTLQKPVQALPAAQDDGAARVSADEDPPEAKPVKRKRHRAYRVARSNLGGLRQRKVAVDAYQVRHAPSRPYGAAAQPAAEEANAEGDKPAGPIAKFFTWLKGGNKKPDEPAVAEEPQEDHIRRGLGMQPAE